MAVYQNPSPYPTPVTTAPTFSYPTGSHFTLQPAAPTYTPNAQTYVPNGGNYATAASTYSLGAQTERGPQNYIPTGMAISGGVWDGMVDGEEDGMLHAGHSRLQRGHRRTKAVVIGCNYVGTTQELKSPVVDARRTAAFLDHLGYTVRLMTDDTTKTATPTYANIIQAVRWLVTNVHSGDMLFFYFAGHGWRPLERLGAEKAFYDEAILPVDWFSTGPILDDILHKILVEVLPFGVKLHAVMDCEYGAAGFDLPYSVGVDHLLLGYNTPNTGSQTAHSTSLKLQRKISKLKGRELTGVIGTAPPAIVMERVHHKRKLIQADVVLFTASGKQQGMRSALTEGYLNAASRGFNCEQSYLQMLVRIREYIANKGSLQVPEISMSKPYDLNHPFEL